MEVYLSCLSIGCSRMVYPLFGHKFILDVRDFLIKVIL